MKEKREQKTPEQAWVDWVKIEKETYPNSIRHIEAIAPLLKSAFLAGAKSREGK